MRLGHRRTLARAGSVATFADLRGGPETKGMRYVRQLAGVVILAGTLWLGLAQQAAASSANVAALQVALKALGLYPVAVDGVKGPFTEKGVRSFQQQHRLLVDGVPGPQTRQALGPRGRPRLGSRVMHRGQRGWDVAALQVIVEEAGGRAAVLDDASLRWHVAAAPRTFDELAALLSGGLA